MVNGKWVKDRVTRGGGGETKQCIGRGAKSIKERNNQLSIDMYGENKKGIRTADGCCYGTQLSACHTVLILTHKILLNCCCVLIQTLQGPLKVKLMFF